VSLFVLALAAPAGAQTAGSEGDYQYCGSTGSDADYQHCGCAPSGADGDYYTYCASTGAGHPRAPRPAATAVAHQTAPQVAGAGAPTTLPVTGDSPGLLALFGLGLLLIGTGGRLVTGGRRAAARPSARAAR
jgi:hypothetical protein